MFDRSKEIELEVRPASAGCALTKVAVRYPTDDEWVKRGRARRILTRNMSRGMSETIPPQPCEADLNLFEAIALNGAPKLTKAEAEKVLNAMSLCEVTDVRIEGTEAEVDMMTMYGPVQHRMRIPTADQAAELQLSGYRAYTLPHSQHEVRLNMNVAARLYDDCGGSSPDFEGAIPAPHKDQAFRAVIEEINRQVGPKRDEENF